MRPSRVAVVAGVAALAAVVPGDAVAAPSATVCPSGPPACDYSSIPAAVAAVDPGGLVTVAPGTYAGAFTVAKSVRVVGAGAGATTISGESVTIAAGATVVLQAMTIAGAVDTPQLVNEGGLTTRAVVVRSVPGTTSSSREVAGVLNEGTLVMRNTTVTGSSDRVGGILNAGTASLNSSTVRDSSGLVGGIRNTGSLTVVSSRIIHNFAAFEGAISNEGSLVVRGSDISDNGGQGPGGLENFDGAAAVIVDTSMLRNQLSGIFNSGSLTLRRVTLTAWGSGLGSVAGISNRESGSVVLEQSTLDGSDVQYTTHGPTPPPIDNSGEMSLISSVVRDSHSTGPGGGIQNGGTLTLRSSTVTRNISDRSGGGIYNTGALTLRFSTVTSNTALDLLNSGVFGGGIANVFPGVVARHQSQIAGNTPDDCAGC
jgi:hypothetical protein